jgi:3'-5' exonuclease
MCVLILNVGLKKAVLSEQVSLTDLPVMDIETVPGASHYQDLPEGWKSLWKGKISKTVPENLKADDFYHEKAGIMAGWGKMMCISAGFFTLKLAKNMHSR